MPSSKIQFLLDDNEKVIWEGRPDIVTYALRHWPLYLGIIIFCFPTMVTGIALLLAAPQMEAPSFFYLIIYILIFHPLFFFMIAFVSRLIQWRYVRYAITDKRIYIESGMIGRDIKTVEFSQIVSPMVNVGLIEKLRGKGTIDLTTETFRGRHGRTGIRVSAALSSISEPYDIFKMIKKMTLDIRTDEQFPNAMRPDTNPGYNTDYRGPFNG
jgi:membrane protein YdbS with pleckstrin-like domain